MTENNDSPERDLELETMMAMTIKDMGKMFVSLKEEIGAAEDVTKELKHTFDTLRLRVIPEKLDEMGLDNVKITGVGRVSITADAYCSVVADQKFRLYDWLRDNDHEDLIQDNVNSGTLKAFIKEQIKAGNDVPDDTIINFIPYDRASVTKA